MPKEDITHCCMNCERLAGELEDMKSLIREMVFVLRPLDAFVGLLSKGGAEWNRGTMVDLYVKTQAILNRPEVKELLKEEK